MSNYGDQFMACPQCGKTIEAESVDVGVGLYIRDEWACHRCGWEMYGPDDRGFITCDEVPFAPPGAYADYIAALRTINFQREARNR